MRSLDSELVLPPQIVLAALSQIVACHPLAGGVWLDQCKGHASCVGQDDAQHHGHHFPRTDSAQIRWGEACCSVPTIGGWLVLPRCSQQFQQTAQVSPAKESCCCHGVMRDLQSSLPCPSRMLAHQLVLLPALLVG